MTYDQPSGGQPWPQQGQPYNPYPQQQYPPPGYAPQPQYPPGYPPPTGPRRSWPRRHKILTTILGVFGFFVVLGVIGAIAGSGNHTVTTGQAGSTPSSTPSSAPAVPQAAKIGTPVRDGKFQFTITSVSHAKSVGDTAAGLGDTAQGKYTILHVTVTNIGSQAQTLDDSSQYVYDASGRKYDVSTSADIDLNSASGSDSVFFNNINPGNTVRGELAFDMPAGVKVVKAELHDSAFSGGVTVSLR
jgi:hypothetical protein